MITLRPVCPPLGRLSTTVQQDQRCTAKRSKVLKYLKIQRGRVHERNVKKKRVAVEMTAGANKTKRHKKVTEKRLENKWLGGQMWTTGCHLWPSATS